MKSNHKLVIIMVSLLAISSTLTKALKSLTTTKIYAVNPFEDEAGILRKTLVHSFTTTPLSY